MGFGADGRYTVCTKLPRVVMIVQGRFCVLFLKYLMVPIAVVTFIFLASLNSGFAAPFYTQSSKTLAG